MCRETSMANAVSERFREYSRTKAMSSVIISLVLWTPMDKWYKQFRALNFATAACDGGRILIVGAARFSLFLDVHAVFPTVFPLGANLLHYLDIVADVWMARVGLDLKVETDFIIGYDFFLHDFVVRPVSGLL